jgi:membrane-bound lytic murein transglycosylase D
LPTAQSKNTPHSLTILKPLIALTLLTLAACAQTPPQTVSSRPQLVSSALAAAPAAISSSTTGVAITATPAAPSADSDTSRAPAAPAAAAPEAATAAASVAAATTITAVTGPTAAPPAVTPAALESPAPGLPGTEPAGAPAAEPTQVAGLTPAQYGDLFDRMRAGFRLPDDSDRRAVDQQLHWYVSNPEYLQRAFGRADLYLYYIVTELERRGMPLELALLPVVESAFQPYAYSRARAAGLWQFIPGTGTKYGLKQDWWYDGRRDIVESTRAALDYLQSLHDEFGGDWLLAIAAYNCGEALVERAVEMNRAAGRPIEFWNLWLPTETRAYVPKLLAMKRLVQDPEAYGLEISPIPNQPYFVRVETGGQMNLKLAAEISGISPDDLYELNPAFHRWATDPTGPHFLLLPVEAADLFEQNINQLNADQRLGVKHYGVNRGDSIASVAREFNTTVNVIREINDMPIGGLAVGDDLRVPTAIADLPAKVMLAAAQADGRVRPPRSHVRVQIVHHGDSLWTIARRHGLNVNTLAMLNGLQPGDALRAGQRIRLSSGSAHTAHRRLVYTVRDGDTMSQIAQLFQCSVPQLLAWNGLSARSHIHTGQKLRIHLATRHG